jgi:hypothetical protein
MKQIQIIRNNNVVTFEPITIDPTELFFFTNLDPQQPHWPSLITNQLGPAPSPNSSQAAVPIPSDQTFPFTYTYGCKLHSNESGTVTVVAQLQAAQNTTFQNATQNQAIVPQPAASGGAPPFQFSGQLFQIVNSSGQIIQQGSGSIGPGLSLSTAYDTFGTAVIMVSGTPTVAGTYNFTFSVTDSAQHNLQQVQYAMTVVSQ